MGDEIHRRAHREVRVERYEIARAVGDAQPMPMSVGARAGRSACRQSQAEGDDSAKRELPHHRCGEALTDTSQLEIWRDADIRW
jgi:hypothetical protein